MKKILFICLISCCVPTQTNSQKKDSNMNAFKIDGKALLVKSKKQKTAAWILLGSGLVMEIVGLTIVANDITYVTIGFANTEPHKNSAAGPILVIAGTGAILGSIPFFIGSGNNKRKANPMLIKEKVLLNPELNMKKYFVAAGLEIKL